MELSGKKVLILVEQLYNEFEFWYPDHRLKGGRCDGDGRGLWKRAGLQQ